MSAVGMKITLHQDLDTTADHVRSALAHEGFGVLTEIDVQATLRSKIGAQIEGYRILGVCNPRLAKQALDVDRSVGLLLPCTVVVREGDADSTVVEVLDPNVMVSVSGDARLHTVADEVARRLGAAIRRLAESDAT